MGNTNSVAFNGGRPILDSEELSQQLAMDIGDIVLPALDNSRGILKFHQVHGENVRLLNACRQARRVDSFCKGLAFSNRPVEIDEYVIVKFSEVSTSWSGVLRFGFTNTDPATLRADMPKYACPDMTNKPGNWAKALSERYCVQDNIVHFFVRQNGDVYYGVNGILKGLFLAGLNTASPLWVLVDIYGNSRAVEFLDPADVPVLRRPRHAVRSALPLNNEVANGDNNDAPLGPVAHVDNVLMPVSANNAPSTAVHLDGFARDFQRFQIVESSQGTGEPQVRQPDLRYHADVLFATLKFHNTHGRNVRLSNDRLTALRSEAEYTAGYVFTARPIRVEEVVVIKITHTQRDYVGGVAFGLTTCDPVHLRGEQLPDDADVLIDRPEYWIVNKDIAGGPKVDDELGFYIDRSGAVWFYRNGQEPRTVLHVDQTQQFWVFFDLYGSTRGVRLVGCTRTSSLTARDRASTSQRGAVVASTSVPGAAPSPSSFAHPAVPLRVQLPPAATVGFSGQSIGALPAPLEPERSAGVLPASFAYGASTLAPRFAGPTTSATATHSQVPARPAVAAKPPCPPRQQSVSVASSSTAASLSRHSEPHSTALARQASAPGVLRQEDECTICMVSPKDCTVYTCGHVCMCYDCAKIQWQTQGVCPICRSQIKDVIRLYHT